MNITNHHNTGQDYESDSGPGLKDLFTLLRFVYHAVARHKILLIACIVIVLALVFVAIKIMPRSYEVSSRILIHSSTTISSLAKTGNRLNPKDNVFGLVELMKSQENLEGIVSDADLIEKWKKTRYGIWKKKDELFRKLFGPPSDEDIRDMLVSKLDGRLRVLFNGGVLIIVVEWEDPWVALELHKVVLNRFFEHRRVHELGEIRETIQLLEQKHKQGLEQLQAIIEKNRILATEKAELEIQQEQNESNIGKPRSTFRTSRVRAPAGMSAEQKEELERVSAELESVQNEIARARNDYNRRLDAEKDKLAKYQTQYGPQHPEIIKTTRYIELLSAQEAVPGALRKKEHTLETLIEKLQAAPADSEKTETTRRWNTRPRDTVVDIKEKDEGRSSSQKEIAALLFESELMTAEYNEAEDAVNRLKTQLENTRLELDATEAAFAYRYRLTKPPVFPRRPSKPKGLRLMLAGVFLSIFLGISLSVFVDIRSGIILESWQIEKITNIPLLGEIEEPR
ncbi:MAG: hypothetical protein JXR76_29455 [Deltaproteobacteria bacterium]|nr:hypothetical protein [Deltaproteobacteria bacterium]